MRKNRTMRVAALLLALTLITSCFVGGTFAKYTTSGSANDTARVAKWGIELSVNGEGKLFDTEYDGTGNAITVKSQNTDNLVAPGTADATGITFTLSGKPEVATKVTATLGNDVKDVFLKKDDGSTYNPVVFTLSHTYGSEAFSIQAATTNTGVTFTAGTAGTDGKTTETLTGTLAQINAVLANLTNAMSQNNPSYPYDDSFTLTWAWDFGDPANNTLDTQLGNIAAGTVTGLTDGTDYCLNVSYNFSITVEQVD